MSDVVKFPGEYRTELDRQKDRWTSVAFIAAAGLAGNDRKTRQLFLQSLLDAKFADVPDKQPALDDMQAYAAFAVKLLLRTLTDDSDTMREAGERTAEYFMKRMKDPDFIEKINDPE
jgi:hypothetical protein